MKQYLIIPNESEINQKSLYDILSIRYPEYNVFRYSDYIRIKKNVLTTVNVKVKHEMTTSYVSVENQMAWWIWILGCWFFYLIFKRGFVDDVYHTLEADIKKRYPHCSTNFPTEAEKQEWKYKTRYLNLIGITLLMWNTLFILFPLGSVRALIINTITKDNIFYLKCCDQIIAFIPTVLWILLAYRLIMLSSIKQIKIACSLLLAWGILSMTIIITYFFDIKIPSTTLSIINITKMLFLFLSGGIIQHKIYNGTLSYIKFSLLIMAICNLVSLVIKYWSFSVYDNDQDIAMVISVLFIISSPFFFTAYILLAHALCKISRYPIINGSASN